MKTETYITDQDIEQLKSRGFIVFNDGFLEVKLKYVRPVKKWIKISRNLKY